jgi:hypothetical protein
MSFRPLYLLIILLLSGAKISAQEFEDDAGLWLNIYLEKKISDKIDIHLNQKNRIEENVSLYRLGYADLGITYHFSKNIRVMADYVFAKRRNLDGSYSNRHQGYMAFILRKKWNNFTFSYRNLVQTQVTDYYSSEDGKVPVYYERNKLVVKYEFTKRYSAYAAEELYLPFYQVRSKGLDRSRTAVGLEYKLSKKSDLEFYFVYQHELNAFSRTNRLFAYGIGYSKAF